MNEETSRAGYEAGPQKSYDLQAGEFAAPYNSAPSPYLAIASELLKKGNRILDVEAGSGGDLKAYLSAGFDAYGLEASDRLRRGAAEEFALDEIRLQEGSLPLDFEANTIPFLKEKSFHFVLCASALQHIEDKHLFDALFSMNRALTDDGYLFLSIPVFKSDGDTHTQKDEQARPFVLRPPEQYTFMLSRMGIDEVRRREASGRWNILFRKRKGTTLRPIGQIESILREDSKTTTYKFALLRSLTELAVQTPLLATWRESGTVHIPLEPLIRKWIEYYWPLVREKGIPQGRIPKGKSDMTFRTVLAELIETFPKSSGGLSSFLQGLKNGDLDAAARQRFDSVRKTIGQAILKGPVTYSGSEKTGGKLFEPEGNGLRMPGALWTEFAVLGRWIEDSIVLRWAEFTSHLSSGTIEPGRIIDLLLESINERRDVKAAQNIYQERAKRATLFCVWTGKGLTEKDLAGDHAIPFVLWRNNDLWNLLPADRSVNGRKRDKLPTAKLLDSSKGRIISCWEMLYENYKQRFLKEIQEFSGHDSMKGFPSSARDDLFSVFRESVEVTAVQRGIPRWNG